MDPFAQLQLPPTYQQQVAGFQEPAPVATPERRKRLTWVFDNLRKASDHLRSARMHVSNAALHATPTDENIGHVPCEGYNSWVEMRNDLNECLLEVQRTLGPVLKPIGQELYGNGNWEET